MTLRAATLLRQGDGVLEDVWPVAERDRFRATWLAEWHFYNFWLHLGATTLFGGAIMCLGVRALHAVRPWEWGALAGLIVASNAAEWWLHKMRLHRRVAPFEILYDRHTPKHHRVFVPGDMAIRNLGEARLVLLPWWGIVALLAGVLPVILVLRLILPWSNLAALFAVESMAYVLSYEWLHLAYHLPPDSFVGRLPPIRFLRRHHATHHDPRLMMRWNFNITIPLWDLVRGTYRREAS